MQKNLWSKIITATLLGSLLILLPGCGGGGGNGGDNTPLPPIDRSINGEISAAARSSIDSDVNDPQAPYLSNDSIPQNLKNPFIVGGFASRFGSGIAGDRFETAGDRVDRYTVFLAQGQTVILAVSDHLTAAPAVNDLDLSLFDPTNPDNDRSSLGTSDSESILVPADASYDIVVTAFRGISNYILTVSSSITSVSENTLRLENAFVPGEVIVRFKDQAVPASGSLMGNDGRTVAGMFVRAGQAERPLLLSLGDNDQQRLAFAELGLDVDDNIARILTGSNPERLLKYNTLRAVKALRSRADVVGADPNYIRTTARLPNDQYYGLQWHYPLINLPQAWDQSLNSSGVTVAVIDTGVYLSHPDLAANLLGYGYDFILDPAASLDGDGIDDNPDDPGDSTTMGLSTFHGTHVAGIIGAVTNNAAGVAGVSWDGGSATSKILPIRVLGQGGGTSYDLIQGLRYAAGLENDSGTTLSEADRAQIINLSLAGGGFSQSEQNTFTELRENGIFCFAAAGNESSATFNYPASYADVVAVSAVDIRKQLAWYSNFGGRIDIAAPGGDTSVDRNGDGYGDGVLSTLADDTNGNPVPVYGFSAGTSMAAPHVAGVAALMKGVHPGLTPADFDILLAAGAITEDLAENGPAVRDDSFGYGLIDAIKAYQEAFKLANNNSLPAVLAVTPNSLHFGPDDTSRTIILSNAGAGTVSISSITENADWLEIMEESVDADGLGTYIVTVDRSGLADSFYSTAIVLDAGPIGITQLEVSMQVSTSSATIDDVGRHYVLLIDPATGDVLQTVSAENTSGSYAYRFEDIENGAYYIVAGSDSDNDGLICDQGEACGGYPTLDELASVAVADNGIMDIDFVSGFSVNFNTETNSTVNATRIYPIAIGKAFSD